MAYGTDPGSAESGNIRPGGGSVERPTTRKMTVAYQEGPNQM